MATVRGQLRRRGDSSVFSRNKLGCVGCTTVYKYAAATRAAVCRHDDTCWCCSCECFPDNLAWNLFRTNISGKVLMVVQSGLVIASCYYGWGSEILRLPENNIHKAERVSPCRPSRFLTSSFLSVVLREQSVHGIGTRLFQSFGRMHPCARK